MEGCSAAGPAARVGVRKACIPPRVCSGRRLKAESALSRRPKAGWFWARTHAPADARFLHPRARHASARPSATGTRNPQPAEARPRSRRSHAQQPARRRRGSRGNLGSPGKKKRHLGEAPFRGGGEVGRSLYRRNCDPPLAPVFVTGSGLRRCSGRGRRPSGTCRSSRLAFARSNSLTITAKSPLG